MGVGMTCEMGYPHPTSRVPVSGLPDTHVGYPDIAGTRIRSEAWMLSFVHKVLQTKG